MFESVEKVVYINLAHRTDRRAQIEEELRKVFPEEKIVRYEAIRVRSYGALGCSLSHLGALELAQREGWKNVLVVEDDMVWNDLEANYEQFEKLLGEPHDVIMLGGIFVEATSARVHSAAGGHAQQVSQVYLPRLIANVREGSQLLKSAIEARGRDGVGLPKKYHHKYHLDIYWSELQKRDLWMIAIPHIAVQRDGFSDNDNRIKSVHDGGIVPIIRMPFSFRRR